MNKDKSTIFGSKNTTDERVADLGDLMGVNCVADAFAYLGHMLTVCDQCMGW